MAKLRIGVLRGGSGDGYEDSLRTGQNVLKNLSPKYSPVDMLLTKDGFWHVWGAPTSPNRIGNHVDLVFNALHGDENEANRVFQYFNIPHTGSRSLANTLSANRHLIKDFLIQNSIKTPLHKRVNVNDGISASAQNIFNSIPPPWAVKFGGTGSYSIVLTARSIGELKTALGRALQAERDAVVEEYINGDDATCFVVEGTGRGEHHGFVVAGSNRDSELREMAIGAHRTLGMRHYSRGHFIVSPKRGIYLLQMDSRPSLAEGSLFAKSLEQTQIPFSDFIDHIVTLARRDK